MDVEGGRYLDYEARDQLVWVGVSVSGIVEE